MLFGNIDPNALPDGHPIKLQHQRGQLLQEQKDAARDALNQILFDFDQRKRAAIAKTGENPESALGPDDMEWSSARIGAAFLSFADHLAATLDKRINCTCERCGHGAYVAPFIGWVGECFRQSSAARLANCGKFLAEISERTGEDPAVDELFAAKVRSAFLDLADWNDPAWARAYPLAPHERNVAYELIADYCAMLVTKHTDCRRRLDEFDAKAKADAEKFEKGGHQ